MQNYVNINGAWRTAPDEYVNINGVWRTVASTYTNIGGTWRELLKSELYLKQDKNSLNGVTWRGYESRDHNWVYVRDITTLSIRWPSSGYAHVSVYSQNPVTIPGYSKVYFRFYVDQLYYDSDYTNKFDPNSAFLAYGQAADYTAYGPGAISFASGGWTEKNYYTVSADYNPSANEYIKFTLRAGYGNDVTIYLHDIWLGN